MGADRMSTKVGGFFNLFDWNQKSRKKLFANGSGSPDGKKQVRRSDENLPSTRFHLGDAIDRDDDICIGSVRESSDYSCASSVTDGEGGGSRAPGVVARLMGLDSLPTNSVSEPCSSPIFESRFARDEQYRKRSPEFEGGNRFTDARSRAEVSMGKLPDWRFQKMPSSPIDRFQHEILPPRLAKCLPNHKLLSPIKNPRFVMSSKDAAQVMETAVKIIEPGMQANCRVRVPQIDPSSLPLTFRDAREYIATPQRAPSNLGLSRAATVESNAMKCLQGKPMNRSWNGSDGSSSCRSSPGRDQASCVGTQSKGKSVSLAIQAKVNVQKREGRGVSTQREQEEFSWSQPYRNLTSSTDQRSQKKTLPPNTSSVLKQNNQKQNCQTSKDKLPAKRSLPNNHEKKVLFSLPSCSSERNKTSNKLHGISKGGCSKEVPSSRTDNLPRKKRVIDGNQDSERRVYSGKSQNFVFVDDKRKAVEDTAMEYFEFTPPLLKPKFVSRLSLKTRKNDARDECHTESKGRKVQANIIIDEKSNKDEDRICETDVASFTFTSPLVKPTFGIGSSTKTGKKTAVDDCTYGKEWTAMGSKNKKWSSQGLNMMGDDALSILLEQKLRGLAFESESCTSAPFKFSSLDSPSTCRSSPHSETTLSEKSKSWFSGEAKVLDAPNSRFLPSDGQEFGKRRELQLAENFMECCSSSSTCEEVDHYASPFSVLEANFSNDSCNSCESYDSSYGTRMSSSSILAQNVWPNNTLKCPQAESEMDLSDSASSSFTVSVDGECVKRIRKQSPGVMHTQEVEYVKEILFTANVNPKNFVIGRTSEKLDALLFDLLERKSSATTRSVDGKLKRKLLFDCVRECLDSTQCRHFRAGYRSWARGMSTLRQDNLPVEIYEEILSWEGMGRWMVDELVDKDMSSQLGKKENFESAVFETGVEIEKKILGTLIDEMVAGLLA